MLSHSAILSTQHSALSTMTNPPILKTWPRLYGAVLLALAVEIVLFYLLTRAFH